MTEIVEVITDTPTVIEVVTAGPQGPSGGGGGAVLDDINPAPVTAQVLGGTVDRQGRLNDPVAASDLASETEMTALVALTESLNTGVGVLVGALANGVDGGSRA